MFNLLVFEHVNWTAVLQKHSHSCCVTCLHTVYISHGLGSAAGWGRLDDAAVVKVWPAVCNKRFHVN